MPFHHVANQNAFWCILLTVCITLTKNGEKVFFFMESVECEVIVPDTPLAVKNYANQKVFKCLIC
jgi:hypothetical protein